MSTKREKANDVYFGMSAYDVATYSKHYGDLAEAVTSTPVDTAAIVEDDNT